MTATGGRPSRQQVRHGGRVVPGLYERQTATGQRVFEVCCKRNGKVVRRRLAAQTATDAVREQRALLAKLDTRAPVASRPDLSLRELREQWQEWATGPASNLVAGTVETYLYRLDHALRLLGPTTKAAAVRPPDLRVMLDKLAAEGRSGWYTHGILTAVSALFRSASGVTS